MSFSLTQSAGSQVDTQTDSNGDTITTLGGRILEKAGEVVRQTQLLPLLQPLQARVDDAALTIFGGNAAAAEGRWNAAAAISALTASAADGGKGVNKWVGMAIVLKAARANSNPSLLVDRYSTALQARFSMDKKELPAWNRKGKASDAELSLLCTDVVPCTVSEAAYNDLALCAGCRAAFRLRQKVRDCAALNTYLSEGSRLLELRPEGLLPGEGLELLRTPKAADPKAPLSAWMKILTPWAKATESEIPPAPPTISEVAALRRMAIAILTDFPQGSGEPDPPDPMADLFD